jgi:hypothetical protein
MNVWSIRKGTPAARRLTGAAALCSDLAVEAADPRLPRLIPTTAAPGAIAALLVGESSGGGIARNGVPLPAGAHLLVHADRLDFGEHTWWVAAACEVSEVPLDPLVHGEDVYCYITKARLRAGDPVVVCPGRPGGGCGAIYRKAAWDMALAANARFRCPRCGFEPAAGEWRPELPEASNLARLFELARAYRAGGAP